MLKFSALIARRRKSGAAFAAAEAEAKELDRTARRLASDVAVLENTVEADKAALDVAKAEKEAGESDNVKGSEAELKNSRAALKATKAKAKSAAEGAAKAAEAVAELADGLDEVLAQTVNTSGGTGNASAVVAKYHELCSSTPEGAAMREEFAEALLIVDNQVSANPTFPDEDAEAAKKAKAALVQKATRDKAEADRKLKEAKAALAKAETEATKKAAALNQAAPSAAKAEPEPEPETGDDDEGRTAEEIEADLVEAAKNPLDDEAAQAERVAALEAELAAVSGD